MSNFISSASDRKRKKTKLNNYTLQHNEGKASTDFRTYSLNPVCQITSISTVRQIEQASNVTKSIGQPKKLEQKVIARVIFYEKYLRFICNYDAR